MDAQEKALARKLFKLKIHESNGQKFEDLFRDIMNYREPNFRSIKPWGNIGDRKNDGYIKTKGIFFQVHAPENVIASYVATVKKLKIDFDGLLSHWSPVNEYFFVLNDKYAGVNADCEIAIEELRKIYSLNDAGFITAKDLENYLFSLEDDQILTVVGNLPDPARIQLSYSVLSEVIGHIMTLSLPSSIDENVIVPDWDQKIKFNKIGELEARFLNNGYQQIGALDEYLFEQSNFFSNEVKDKLQKVYIDNKDNLFGSDLFWEIVRALCPKMETPYQTAAIVLISKYFEACDIFEEPK